MDGGRIALPLAGIKGVLEAANNNGKFTDLAWERGREKGKRERPPATRVQPSRGLRARAGGCPRSRLACEDRPRRKGSHWGIKTDIREYGLRDSLKVLPKYIDPLAGLRTRLNEFSEEEQCRLINWGYAVCDAAMRRFMVPQAAVPPGWPYRDYALNRG